MATYYAKGDWDATCEVCGFKYKASQMRLRWDGLRVCQADWEPRQPQDFAQAIIEHPNVPWSRDEPPEIFTAFCTLNGRSGIVGYATVGCAIVGRTVLE